MKIWKFELWPVTSSIRSWSDLDPILLCSCPAPTVRPRLTLYYYRIYVVFYIFCECVSTSEKNILVLKSTKYVRYQRKKQKNLFIICLNSEMSCRKTYVDIAPNLRSDRASAPTLGRATTIASVYRFNIITPHFSNYVNFIM